MVETKIRILKIDTKINKGDLVEYRTSSFGKMVQGTVVNKAKNFIIIETDMRVFKMYEKQLGVCRVSVIKTEESGTDENIR